MQTADASTSGRPQGRAACAFADDLRKQISGGQYQHNQFLPSVRQFSHDYALAPKTVLRGLKQLERDGLLTAQPRQGFRVLTQKPQKRPIENDGPIAYILKLEPAGEWPIRQRLIFEALQASAAKRGWSVLGVPANDHTPAMVVEQLRKAQVCGAIFDALDKPYLEYARRIGLPVIMLDVWTTYMEFDAVTRDEFHGGYLAGEYLCSRGHKNIDWFGPLQESPNAVTRFGGAIAALVQARLDIPAEHRFVASGSIEQCAEEFLDQPRRPTAVLALWRKPAIALANAARRRGLVLGRDLDLVGWCLEEELSPIYESICPGLLEETATVVWSIRPVIEAALDRVAQRRGQRELSPVRIHLPMRVLLPACTRKTR